MMRTHQLLGSCIGAARNTVTSVPSWFDRARLTGAETTRERWVDVWYNLGYTIGMKTAISIPDSLFEAAERVAARLGISRSELYRRAVRQFLEAQGHDVIREKLDEVYGADPDAGRLDPVVEYLQDLSLPEDDW